MSLISSVGVGYGEDSFEAGASACQDAVSRLENGAIANLIIVFASSKYNQEEMLRGVRSVSKDTLLVGSSTAGEISTEGPVGRNSIVVMAISSKDVDYYAAVGTRVSDNPHEAGRSVAQSVKDMSSGNLKSFMMFPNVVNGNGADTVRGVLEVLGEHFPVVGGASGDDFQFKETYQYLNDKVYSDSVVALGLNGDFKMGIGVKHGWIPVGTPMKVTKSEGAILHEVDNKPAISIYEDYFGAEEAVKVAKLAAKGALEQLDGVKPKAIIVFNCIARNKLFGQRSGEEISAIQEVLGRDVPLIGFYTYGEQAPMNGEVKNINQCNSAFHNETVVIAVLA